ncbi:MAG TPA: hypothetical protein VIO61_05340 [Anaerolineaceae bacterium]
MNRENELREILSDMAEDIVQVEPYPDHWAEWVVHILKYLDHTAQRAGDTAEFKAMLETLQQAVQVRLESGRWKS